MSWAGAGWVSPTDLCLPQWTRLNLPQLGSDFSRFSVSDLPCMSRQLSPRNCLKKPVFFRRFRLAARQVWAFFSFVNDTRGPLSFLPAPCFPVLLSGFSLLVPVDFHCSSFAPLELLPLLLVLLFMLSRCPGASAVKRTALPCQIRDRLAQPWCGSYVCAFSCFFVQPCSVFGFF